jgi:CRP-like cAMP-binding protein
VFILKTIRLKPLFAPIRTYYQTLIPELTNESWSKVEEKFTFQYLKRGELLTRNGKVCKQVSFINRGLLRMFYLVDGKEICTAFAKENDYLAQ